MLDRVSQGRRARRTASLFLWTLGVALLAAPGARAGGGEGSSADEERGEAAFERAHEAHQEGAHARAAAGWEEAARLGYRPATAMYNAACAHARERQTDAALAWLERAIDAGFDAGDLLERDRDLASLRPDPRFRKLVEEHGSGGRERELRRLEGLLGLARPSPQALAEVGLELHHLGAYQDAIRAWQRALAAGPQGEAALTYDIACARALAGDLKGALDDLERAVELGYGDGDDIEQDADLDALRGEARYPTIVARAEALELPEGAVHGPAPRPSQRQWRAALARYQADLAAHPGSGRAWFSIGFARLRLGQAGDAAEAFEKAVALGHRRATSAYNVACSKAQAGEVEAAFTWLARARELGFDDDWTLASDPDLDPLRDDPRFPRLDLDRKHDHGRRHRARRHDHDRDDDE